MLLTETDAERLQDIVFSAFEGKDEDSLYTPEGYLARSTLMLIVWTLDGLNPAVLTQISENIEFLYDKGLLDQEEFQEALKIISGKSQESSLTPGLLTLLLLMISYPDSLSKNSTHSKVIYGLQ